MNTLRKPLWLLRLTGLLLLVFAAGCGGPTGTPADPAQSLEALHTVLDAWKAGKTPEQLADGAPSIHVADVDWSGGFRLIKYTDGEGGRLVGFDMNYPVSLELKGRDGKAVKKTAVYTVTTRPELLVLRQEG